MRTTHSNEKGRGAHTHTTLTTRTDDTALSLIESRGEPRVDSRVVAHQLAVQHESTIRILTDYEGDFRTLGVFRFEIGKPGNGAAGGRPERFVMLNEDQCYLLLAYSRNTDRVRALKLKLVLAFRGARERLALRDADYLPGYHALHDEVAALAQVAHDAGSHASDDVFHCNINKLVNKVAGISAGMRDRLTGSERLMVVNLQAVIRNALHRALAAGADHKVAYLQAKDAALEFVAAAGRLLGGV